MDREQILEQSRKENQKQDLFEQEVIKEGRNASSIVAATVATVLVILQLIADKGMNYGMYAMLFSIFAAQFIVKSVRMHKKHEIVVAITYTLITLLFAAAHIYSLFVI